MRLLATYVVVNKAFRGLLLSYNQLVYRTLCFHVKYFGVQSSIDPYNPTHNQLRSSKTCGVSWHTHGVTIGDQKDCLQIASGPITYLAIKPGRK